MRQTYVNDGGTGRWSSAHLGSSLPPVVADGSSVTSNVPGLEHSSERAPQKWGSRVALIMRSSCASLLPVLLFRQV